MLQVVFIVEFKISNFFAVTEDNHKSPVFSVSGMVFAWELFGGNVPICLSKTTNQVIPRWVLQKCILSNFLT